MNKFEYKIIESEDNDEGLIHGSEYHEIESFLNKMGEKGWELVSTAESGSSYMSVFVFKRLLIPNQEKQLSL